MLKRFLGGVVTGAGFGIGFLVVGVAAYQLAVPRLFEARFPAGAAHDTAAETAVVPALEARTRFLGSTGVYASGFLDNKSAVLAAGPGGITGTATVEGQAVDGLRLRLALNGRVLSQWATTGADGAYRVAVPYGTYTIDGFELDMASANAVLAGMIQHPRGAHTTGPFEVGAEGDGRGLDCRFVDPIVKKPGRRSYAAGEPVRLEWEPHPGAAHYVVQVYEKQDPHAWSNDALFAWSSRPNVPEPRLDLVAEGARLKPGHFYAYEVEARDARDQTLSESVRMHSGYDFEVVE